MLYIFTISNNNKWIWRNSSFDFKIAYSPQIVILHLYEQFKTYKLWNNTNNIALFHGLVHVSNGTKNISNNNQKT